MRFYLYILFIFRMLKLKFFDISIIVKHRGFQATIWKNNLDVLSILCKCKYNLYCELLICGDYQIDNAHYGIFIV